MKKHKSSKGQAGSVLMITVILLIVTSLGALYSMRGTIGQEKMAANLNNKAATFNTAEAGSTMFFAWFKNQLSTSGWPTGGSRDGWKTSIPFTNTGTLVANSGTNGYHWIDTALIVPEGSNPFWDDANKKVTVYVTGHLLNGASLLGETTYKITLSAFGGGILPSLPVAPLTVGGYVTGFDPANSNAFQIDGGAGAPAIATDESIAGGDSAIKTDIGKTKPDNYTGACETTPCVKAMNLGSPWNSAAALQAMVNDLKTNTNVNFYAGAFDTGTWDKSKPVTVVLGDFDFNGNLGEYDGVIIALGGTFKFNGGGNTKINGSVYVAKLNQPGTGDWTFGTASNSISGGGNLNLTYVPNPGGAVGPGGPGAKVVVSQWFESVQ